MIERRPVIIKLVASFAVALQFVLATEARALSIGQAGLQHYGSPSAHGTNERLIKIGQSVSQQRTKQKRATDTSTKKPRRTRSAPRRVDPEAGEGLAGTIIGPTSGKKK